jgi:hypothetical protein
VLEDRAEAAQVGLAQPSKRRRINGDGSVYKRGDGYWVGAFYARTTTGARKRVVVYGKTLDEARNKLGKA